MRRVDITVEVVGTNMEGKPINGILTARADIGRLPWPDQMWDDYVDGENPLPIDFDKGAPIEVKRIIKTEVIE